MKDLMRMIESRRLLHEQSVRIADLTEKTKYPPEVGQYTEIMTNVYRELARPYRTVLLAFVIVHFCFYVFVKLEKLFRR